MNMLMSERKFNPNDVMNELFMTTADIQLLQQKGHEVGLHSHGHPTTMHKLDKQTQQTEYQTNYDFLKNALGVNPQTMSHPNGNYSTDTLDILGLMGISLGFRATMSPPIAPSVLEIPREDHSNLLSKIST
jgi:peptidoglycan/xylan/chitin deacetylase (PgdA/CDA1 family)